MTLPRIKPSLKPETLSLGLWAGMMGATMIWLNAARLQGQMPPGTLELHSLIPAHIEILLCAMRNDREGS